MQTQDITLDKGCRSMPKLDHERRELNSTVSSAHPGTSYAGFSAERNIAVEQPFFFTGKF